MRRLANRMVHAAWNRLGEVGTVRAGDAMAQRFGRFGSGSSIGFPPGAIFGERWIWIGEGTLVGPHVSLSAGMGPGQEMVTNPVVAIGNGCLIGRGSAVVGHLSIEIGDDVFTGMHVYITDQNHGYDLPDTPIGRQDPTERPVSIGAGSWLGSGVIVLPGATIGEHAVIAAQSVVRDEIPARSVAAGVPARVVKRL